MNPTNFDIFIDIVWIDIDGFKVNGFVYSYQTDMIDGVFSNAEVEEGNLSLEVEGKEDDRSVLLRKRFQG